MELTKNLASFSECVEFAPPVPLPSTIVPAVLLLRRLLCAWLVSARLWLSRLETLSHLLTMRSKCRSSTAAHDFRRAAPPKPPLYQPAVANGCAVDSGGCGPLRSGSDRHIGIAEPNIIDDPWFDLRPSNVWPIDVQADVGPIWMLSRMFCR